MHKDDLRSITYETPIIRMSSLHMLPRQFVFHTCSIPLFPEGGIGIISVALHPFIQLYSRISQTERCDLFELYIRIRLVGYNKMECIGQNTAS